MDAYREEIQKKELEERHIKERWSEQMLTHENVSSEESFRMLAQESEEVYRENVQVWLPWTMGRESPLFPHYVVLHCGEGIVFQRTYLCTLASMVGGGG